MRRLIAIAMTCSAALAVGLATPAAHASTTQLTVMQDDALMYRLDAATRSRTLDEFKALGADVVKIQLYWSDVVPNTRRKPAGFDGTNPGSYTWGAYDAAVSDIVAHGLQPFISLGGRAPDWATAKRSPRRGINRPNAREFRKFAAAAGAHFTNVAIWSIWNEPNLYSWLAPQRRKGIPQSPSLYRGLYMAGYRGLSDSGHSGDTILLGELMPLGAGSSQKVPPLDFLREMVCLDSRFHQYRGRAAKARKCRKVGRIPTSGIAYHPYNPSGGVHASVGRGEASIATLKRITRLTDALARRGKLPRRLPVYVTEYGFQTNPPDPFQYAIRKVPGFMDESEWITFRNKRVLSYSQYTLRDEPPRRSSSVFIRNSVFQMGLRFRNGKAKPGVYAAFRMPAFVRLRGGNRVEIFGGLRTESSGSAQIESAVSGGRYRSLGSAPLNPSGYFRRVFRVSNASKRKYRITIAGVSRVKKPSR